ncbi:hypothetical protein ACXR2T_10225 [Leucobacter sp. HY1910]
MSEKQKKPEDEAVDQVVGFLTSTKGFIVVGVLLIGLVIGTIWSALT